MSSSPEKRTGHLQLTSSPLQVVRLTTGWWPGPFTPPRLKCSSTEHSDEGPGDSSTLNSLELIFNCPVSATASSVLHWAKKIPWVTMSLNTDRRCAAACVQRQSYARPAVCFMPVTTDVVCTMVRVAADKHSMKDPMPTWLLKTC